MNLGELASKAAKSIKINSPEILTGLGIIGLAATGYLAVRAGRKATRMMEDQDPMMSVKDQAKLTWQCYIPPVAVGVATAACIVGSNQSSGRRTAAAVAAYSITEKAYTEYREHVVEQLGVNKEQKIRDVMAQDRAAIKPLEPGKEIVVIGNGDFLCYEAYTGRYFMSDMETLKRACNVVNAKAINGVGAFVSLDEFYELVGLKFTSSSGLLGWTSERQLELEFTSILSSDGRPCLSFDYNYVKPVY